MAKAHCYGIRNSPRHFPQEAITLEAEHASPDAMQVHRHNRRFNAFDDSFHATAKRQQLPGTRDLPFGKDADNLSVADCVAGYA